MAVDGKRWFCCGVLSSRNFDYLVENWGKSLILQKLSWVWLLMIADKLSGKMREILTEERKEKKRVKQKYSNLYVEYSNFNEKL